MQDARLLNSAIDKELLADILTRLVMVYHPDMIYLFGSYAWGTPDKESDIDLYIVVKDSSQGQADRIRTGLAELTDLNIAVDLMVVTQNELAAKSGHPATLAHKVVNQGVKIYAAA